MDNVKLFYILFQEMYTFRHFFKKNIMLLLRVIHYWKQYIDDLSWNRMGPFNRYLNSSKIKKIVIIIYMDFTLQNPILK